MISTSIHCEHIGRLSIFEVLIYMEFDCLKLSFFLVYLLYFGYFAKYSSSGISKVGFLVAYERAR